MTQTIMMITAVMIMITLLLSAFITVTSLTEMKKEALLSTLGFAAEHCVTPLLFINSEDALTVLESFRSESSIKEVVLLDENNELFAVYTTNGDTTLNIAASKYPYTKYEPDQLLLGLEVVSNSVKIGTIHAKADISTLYRRIFSIFGMIIAVMPLVLISTFFFARFSQQKISQPILQLADIAETTSFGNTPTALPEPKNSNKEVQILYKRFQGFLERIRKGENDLSQASQFLHTIVNSMPSMLIVADTSNKIIMCNQSAMKYSDTTTIIDESLFSVFPVLNDFKTSIEDVHESGEERELRGIEVISGDSGHYDIELFPLKNNVKDGIVIIMTDVSELTLKDQQLAQLQKMETVGTLAGGIAHDFNNIISGIIGTLSLMRDEEVKSLTDKSWQEYISMLSLAGDRAKEMIDQLLSISHKSEMRFTRVSLSQVLKNVTAICDHSIDKSVVIQTESIPVKETVISGNSSQLEQVLLNLCINAAHAMTIMRPPKMVQGGTLRITIEKRVISEEDLSSISYIPPATYLVLSVIDEGIGIPEDQLTQIFDPFYTTKGKGEGTGLGLSMVYNIMNQHQGYIHIDSTPNVGTTVSLFFNSLKETPLQTDEYTVPRLQKFSEKRTVLIIDDDEQIRTIASKMLNRLNLSVLTAENGYEGLETYKKHSDVIDVILLDMVMPGLSGQDVFKELQKMDTDVAVILSSGFAQDNRVQEVMADGIDAFLHKPYKLEELSSMLHAILKQ